MGNKKKTARTVHISNASIKRLLTALIRCVYTYTESRFLAQKPSSGTASSVSRYSSSSIITGAREGELQQ